jgi:hypothetical protein
MFETIYTLKESQPIAAIVVVLSPRQQLGRVGAAISSRPPTVLNHAAVHNLFIAVNHPGGKISNFLLERTNLYASFGFRNTPYFGLRPQTERK